jgi:hypothetical protein
MYLAVVAANTGQALAMGQPVLLGSAAAVWVTVASFVRWYEEPALARQIDAQHEAYRRGVPAWRPRTQPTEVGLVTRQWPYAHVVGAASPGRAAGRLPDPWCFSFS